MSLALVNDVPQARPNSPTAGLRPPLPAMDPTRGKTVALTVDLKTLSGFPLSVLRPSNWHLFKAGNIRKE